jgi:hypothetical protein
VIPCIHSICCGAASQPPRSLPSPLLPQGTATSGNPKGGSESGAAGGAGNAKRDALKAKREARKNKGGGGGGGKKGGGDSDSGSDEDFLARMLKKKAVLVRARACVHAASGLALVRFIDQC